MAMKPHGGKMLALIRPSLPARYGWRRIRCRQFRTKWASKARPPWPPSAPIRETPSAIGRSANEARMTKRSQLSRWPSMTSFRQIDANRRNARKSTGPTTEEGKQRSRCNAVRHGLTAETVIGALEDAEDYKAFEAAIIADYDAQSAVERELVLRLASLLWRLRRATTMETGLFEIQADHLSGFRQARQVHRASREVVYALFGRADSAVSTAIRHRTASRTERKPCPAPRRNRRNLPSIPPLSSRVAFCVSPICPTTRSTASADMKQPFGAKSARSFLRLMPWIAANHGIEGAVSVSAAGKNCRSTSPRNSSSRASVGVK